MTPPNIALQMDTCKMYQNDPRNRPVQMRRDLPSCQQLLYPPKSTGVLLHSSTAPSALRPLVRSVQQQRVPKPSKFPEISYSIAESIPTTNMFH